MALTRRTFLRVLGSAAVGAAAAQVVPSAILPAPAAPAPPGWGVGTPTGVLTWEMLEAAYKQACSGPREPQFAVVSASMARRLGLVYDIEIEA